MDERIVERREDVGNTEDLLSLCDLGTERYGVSFTGGGLGVLFGGLKCV